MKHLKLLFIFTLVSTIASANNVPYGKCERITFKGSVLGMARGQIHFDVSGENLFHFRRVMIGKIFFKHQHYKLKVTTDDKFKNFQTLERIKFDKYWKEVKNDLMIANLEEKTISRFRSNHGGKANPKRIIPLLGDTLDLVALVYFLRTQTPRDGSKKTPGPFYKYIIDEKGSESNGVPKSYSRAKFTFQWLAKKNLWKISAELAPLPSDPQPKDAQKLKYLYVYLKNDATKTPTKIKIKIDGFPEQSFNLHKKSILSYDVNDPFTLGCH